MFRIAAIDDEDIFLEKSKRITKSYFDERKIQYEIKTYKHASLVLEDIKDNIYFDIFLIDIEMDDMNGMELARRIRQLYDSPYIIFVTSYMEYSIKGYEYNAWRYIVKDEMHKNLPLAYDSLIARVKQKKQKFYIIEHPKKTLKLLYEEIYYIYKDGKNAVFVTRNCFWNDRVSKAKEHRIRFDVSAEIYHYVLDDKDLCVMLGNLLDNSIDAVQDLPEQQRWIKIIFKSPNDIFMVEIINPYEGVRKKRKGYYLTTKKENRQMHGIGLRSVEKIVLDYGGDMEISDKDNIFKVMITIFNRCK